MRTPTISILFLCAAIGGPVLAADEPAPAVTPAPTAPTAAPAPAPADATQATAPAAAATAQSAEAAKSAAELRAKETDKRLRNEGYKPAVMNGTTYYCRYQTEVGSHLATRSCATPEDLERIARDSKEVTEKMQFIRTQQAH
jgi:hypothetical protein